MLSKVASMTISRHRTEKHEKKPQTHGLRQAFIM